MLIFAIVGNINLLKWAPINLLSQKEKGKQYYFTHFIRVKSGVGGRGGGGGYLHVYDKQTVVKLSTLGMDQTHLVSKAHL